MDHTWTSNRKDRTKRIDTKRSNYRTMNIVWASTNVWEKSREMVRTWQQKWIYIGHVCMCNVRLWASLEDQDLLNPGMDEGISILFISFLEGLLGKQLRVNLDTALEAKPCSFLLKAAQWCFDCKTAGLPRYENTRIFHVVRPTEHAMLIRRSEKHSFPGISDSQQKCIQC